MKEIIVFPVIARTPWIVRWGVLTAYVFICCGLIANYSKTINSFSKESLVVNILSVFLLCIFFPLSLIIMFFAKIIFHEDRIEHTNHLLIKKQWLYEDITKVETSNTGHIRVTFKNGKSFKISRGEMNLSYLLSILKSKSINLRSSNTSFQQKT